RYNSDLVVNVDHRSSAADLTTGHRSKCKRRHKRAVIDRRYSGKLESRLHMRRIITAYSAHTRILAAREFLSSVADREVLLVAPTRQAADDVVRGEVCDHGASFGVHRFTLASLAVEIASPRLATDGFSILSGVAVEALAARATERCRARGVLRWFDPVARTPGFFRALAATISELRSNSIDLQQLTGSGAAGADLAELVREYASALNETRVADLALIYRTSSGEP